MAEYVQSGEKLLASQYNALVDAIAGPTNATTDQPFTQTKNGVVINGGLGHQTTKAASVVPAMFEVSYGNGYVGDGYNTYQQGDIDANRFNGVFLNIGCWDTLAENGFVLGNGVVLPTIPLLVIIDPTSNNAAVVVYNQALVKTTTKGKLPLCKADEDAGYAFVQIVDNGSNGKERNGNFVLLVGDFTRLGGSSGSDIKTVPSNNVKAAIRGINLYENCEDVRVVQGGVLWRHNVLAGVEGSNIPHLSYTVGTQYVDMMPDSYVNRDNVDGEHVWSNALMPVKLKSIGVVPPHQMGFTQELNSTNTFELYNFDKLSSDISGLSEIDEDELSSYDVLLKHKQPHPYAEDDSTYEGQAEADLQYISLSAFLNSELGDAQLSDLGLSSAEVQHQESQKYITLHGFGDDNTQQWQDLSSKGEYIDVLVRDIDSEGPPGGIELKYVSLPSILSGLSASREVDSETTSLSSMQKSSENDSLQLFGFDGDTLQEFSSISADGDYDIILRNRDAGDRDVEYTSLSAIAQAANYIGDSQQASIGANSIQVKTTEEDQKYIQLYDFDVPRSTGDAEVSLSCGEWKYIGKSSRSSPDPDLQFVVRDLLTNEIKYADVRIKLPMIDATEDVTNIENAISNYITNISSDIGGDLSAELSNYWKVDGTYDDNCHGHSVGDSDKVKAIDLDDKALVNGSANTVKWDTCVLRDQNGTMAACWGNTANIGRTLRHSQGMATVDWQSMQLQTRARGTTVDWEQRELRGAWKIVQGAGQYPQATLTIGSTTIDETQLQQLLALLNP